LALAGISALALAGRLYEQQAETRALEQFPAPGQRYAVGDYQGSSRCLHLFAAGEARPGVPTVIIEAGLGDWSTQWAMVQAGVAQHTRVYTYDRAGLGYSDPSPVPPTSRQIAIDLHQLLESAGVTGPLVLAGHSAGGLHVRAYRDLFPQQVVGMVLIDSSHPGQFDRLPAALQALSDRQMALLQGMLLPADLGLLRLFRSKLGMDAPAQLPQAAQQVCNALSTRPQTLKAVLQEYQALKTSVAQVAAARPLGDLPLMVLSSGMGQVDPAALPPELRGEPLEEMNRIWVELQADLLTLSSNSQHCVAGASHHNIQIEQPQAAVDAILKIVAATSK
jgi:pimeloyl-ACP methyl ester carboxylesterase